MRRIRIFMAFAAVLALAVATAVTATPVRAAGETITLSVNRGSVGQEITISGSGLDPGSPAIRSVNIIFGRNPGTVINYDTGIYEIVKTEPLNTNGTFSTTFEVPPSLGGGFGVNPVVQGTYYVFLTYHIPPDTDTLTVLVKTTFDVLAGNASISPGSGPAGSEVTLSGGDFGNNEELLVIFDDIMLTILGGDRQTNSSGSFSNTKIIIPASTAGDHSIIISGTTSGHGAGVKFTVKPNINILPSPGAVSSTITVSATGFAGGAGITITFNNLSVSTGITESNGSYAHSLPPSSMQQGSYLVIVADELGNEAQVNYEITDAILTVEPDSGSPGWEVELSGTGFKANKALTITFGGYSVAAGTVTDENGEFSTAFNVPLGTIRTFEIAVTDGSNTKEVDFDVLTSGNINPITNFSVPGSVGTQIKVHGGGFTAGSTASITFSGTQVTTTPVGSDGTFSATFTAPSSSSGSHNIIASDGTHTIPYAFVVESTPPAKPMALLPEPGTKASAEAFFDWDDVTDPSGVTYTIQIATSESFSQDTMVLEQTGIEPSEYTVPRNDRLNTVSKEAPYYWRVKAVDKALNEGEWSDVGNFNVGFGMSLPQSGIYIIIIGAALVLAVFTFWLGRKTAYY